MNTTLDNYTDLQRTKKGLAEVTNKSLNLSSRQRQFLLLVDKTDELNLEICKRLSKSINVDQLIDLGLLSTAEKITNCCENDDKNPQELTLQSANHKESLSQAIKQDSTINNVETNPVVSVSEFVEIKTIMVKTLKKTNGLLAADLILRIEKAKDADSLRKLTARWRTTMLESKHDRNHIQAWFEDVNQRLNG